MTTTAEKIKELEDEIRDIADDARQLDEAIESVYKRLGSIKRSTPADPEPLECWGNQPHRGQCAFFNSPAEAMERVNSHKSFRRAVYMREVTPQDELDRQDAARYRKAKEAVERSSHLWTRMLQHSVDQWDEMIDKAMESDER